MTDAHDALSQELGAYALGALDEALTEQVAVHLGECAACRQRVAEYQNVLGLLPHQLDVMQPPAGARTALLARVRADERVQPARRSWRWSWPTGRRVAWSAVAVALVGLLLWNVTLQRQLDRGGQAVMVEELARLPDGRVVALLGTGAPGATARLFVRPDGQQAELAIAALPPLPADRTYQLWFAQPGQPVTSGGTFQVSDRGASYVAVRVPLPLDRVSAIAVTEEPRAGSPQPTGPHLLDARL